MIEKNCHTCKYSLPILPDYGIAEKCKHCQSVIRSLTDDRIAGVELKNWEAKEESNPLKGEFYVKLVCDINGTEVEISETKLNDFVKNIAAEVTESILNNLKGENLEQ